MGLFKKIKKKVQKEASKPENWNVYAKMGHVAGSRLQKYKISKPIGDLAVNVSHKVGASSRDLAKSYAKKIAGQQVDKYTADYKQQYAPDLTTIKSIKTIKNPASVSSSFESTEYKRTKSGLVPVVKSGGADETAVATSTLIFGAIAILFLASAFNKK